MQARQIIRHLLHFLPGFIPSSSQDADCPCTMQDILTKHARNMQAQQCLTQTNSWLPCNTDLAWTSNQSNMAGHKA